MDQTEPNDYPKLQLEIIEDQRSTAVIHDVGDFGVGSPLTATCGAAYVLRRRLVKNRQISPKTRSSGIIRS